MRTLLRNMSIVCASTKKTIKSIEVGTIENVNFVEIHTEVLSISIEELFKSVAASIFAIFGHIEAKDYEITGVSLKTTYDKYEDEKIAIAGININSSSEHEARTVVSINESHTVISKQALVIVSGKIFLKGSTITAEDLEISASEGITIEEMIGSRYANLRISKNGLKTVFTFEPGEISIGLKFYKQESEADFYSEYATRSALIGRNTITIRAPFLTQSASVISGKVGLIEVVEWKVYHKPLIEYSSYEQSEAEIGISLGIRENINKTIRGFSGTKTAIAECDSHNPFADINVLSKVYGNVRDVTNILAGNIVSAGLFIDGSISESSSYSFRQTYAASKAEFRSAKILLGITDINTCRDKPVQVYTTVPKYLGFDDVPPDVVHSSRSHAGFRIGNTVVGMSYYSENDNKGFGASYSSAWGSPDSEIGVQYRDGAKHLDVTYANTDLQRVASVWHEAMQEGVTGFVDRVGSNIQQAVTDLAQVISNTNSSLSGSSCNPKYVATGDSLDEQEEAEAKGKGKENVKEQDKTTLDLSQFSVPEQALAGVSGANDLISTRLDKHFSLIPEAYGATATLGSDIALGLPYLEVGAAYMTRGILAAAESMALPVSVIGAMTAINATGQKFYDKHPWLASSDDYSVFEPPLTEAQYDSMSKDPLLQAKKTAYSLNDEHHTPGRVQLVDMKPVSIYNVNTKTIAGTSSEDGDSGICKVAVPYFPDSDKIKEPWMYPKKLPGKLEDMISGIELYGLNPVEAKTKKDGTLNIHTELPGGEAAARECFKNLTGEYPPLVVENRYEIKQPGRLIQFRLLGKSGHPKVEIKNDLNNIHEKITFK